MQKRLRSFIIDSVPYQRFSGQVKKTYLTRHRISLHRLAEIFFSEIKKNHIIEKASAMAFAFVLSVFPATIFIFTLTPYIPMEDMQGKVMFALKNLLPVSMYKGVAAAIYDIIHIPHGGLLSFGFIFATFAAMNGIMSMIASFNRCYRTSENRGYLRRAAISLLILLLLLVIAFIAIITALYTKNYLDTLDFFNEQILFYLVLTLKLFFFFIVFFMAISVIYYVAPAISVRWRFFSAGSLIASLLIVIFTTVFSYYINNFDSYNKLYGSIGAFIAVMLWFYAISLMLLIGFEINASLDQAKREAFRGNKSE